MATDITTCENCGTTIGKLETPYIYGEHIVCAVCYGRITRSMAVEAASPDRDQDLRSTSGQQSLDYERQPPPELATAPQASASVGISIFDAEGVTVTQTEVVDRLGRVPLSAISMVKVDIRIPWGRTVTVFDLADRTVRYNFWKANNARAFVFAIRSRNPAIRLWREEVWVSF